MKFDLFTAGFHPFPMAVQPGLQAILGFREPASPAPYVRSVSRIRHGQELPAPAQRKPATAMNYAGV